jgi:ribosomal protein L11 methyltransferase
MAKYIQIEFQNISPEQSDLLVAELSQIGFEGFEEGENILKAFIPASDIDDDAVKELAERNDFSYHQTFIEDTNWNAVWESNFQPVIVDDFVHGTPWVAIRAEFHESIAGVEHEIVITPKMSFGTGHHATTFMMIRQMKKINFTGKTVFDFGTGTAVLAILAEKLGAKNILAIDNDDWSVANAAENIDRNDCARIKLEKAGSLLPGEQFDIILANINKNVILDNFSILVKKISPGGILLLSGLLIEDEAAILDRAGHFPLKFSGKLSDRGWICLRFDH